MTAEGINMKNRRVPVRDSRIFLGPQKRRFAQITKTCSRRAPSTLTRTARSTPAVRFSNSERVSQSVQSNVDVGCLRQLASVAYSISNSDVIISIFHLRALGVFYIRVLHCWTRDASKAFVVRPPFTVTNREILVSLATK